MASYLEIIGKNYPAVQCHALGNGAVYEDIIWDGGDPLPLKGDLDTLISVQIKTDMWTKIQGERDRRRVNGVKVGTDWFHSDDTSRIQQIGLVMFGANIPANIMWKTLSGSFVLMTPTLAMQIFGAVAASDQAIFTQAEVHKATMIASANPEEYNYLTGWPLTYGE